MLTLVVHFFFFLRSSVVNVTLTIVNMLAVLFFFVGYTHSVHSKSSSTKLCIINRSISSNDILRTRDKSLDIQFQGMKMRHLLINKEALFIANTDLKKENNDKRNNH